MRFIYLLSTLAISGFAAATSQLDDVDKVAQLIWDNDDERWCRNYLPPVIHTRIKTSLIDGPTTTVHRSTRTIEVPSTSTVTATITAAPKLRRREWDPEDANITGMEDDDATVLEHPERPDYLKEFAEGLIREACRSLVKERSSVTTVTSTLTRPAKTITQGVATTTVTVPTVVTVTTTVTPTPSSGSDSASADEGTMSAAVEPQSQPELEEQSSPSLTRRNATDHAFVAGQKLTTGNALCRDFTGQGDIATSVEQYKFSHPVGQDAYVIDWDISSPIDCCNKCAESGMGCGFWRFADACMIIVNPARSKECVKDKPSVTVTSGSADVDSMAGPGTCGWEIKKA
ncbi:hypothetical protein FPQ18DRAFT_127180 [Pyronema domesticum]|uniref:Apple domain-containing protein n=1 Tax=Pyronema omphalodes (strain CBS 100304) TaxID=1076935 RepID=U4LIG2_PYROM|nr:hypothetical protein FPQ18DRAFT_127180 [Pyronema domesticum]CCX31879.1 Protein of unknown function [Pyronema omphalodes CBS 100304]